MKHFRYKLLKKKKIDFTEKKIFSRYPKSWPLVLRRILAVDERHTYLNQKLDKQNIFKCFLEIKFKMQKIVKMSSKSENILRSSLLVAIFFRPLHLLKRIVREIERESTIQNATAWFLSFMIDRRRGVAICQWFNFKLIRGMWRLARRVQWVLKREAANVLLVIFTIVSPKWFSEWKNIIPF